MTTAPLDDLRQDPLPTVGALADCFRQAAAGALLVPVGALNLFLPLPSVGQASGALALLVLLPLPGSNPVAAGAAAAAGIGALYDGALLGLLAAL